jgi:voltage-gated potassium channel
MANETLKPLQQFQRQLRRFFRLLWVELTIGMLVVVSVALTMIELILLANDQHDLAAQLGTISDLITWAFVTELSLRFVAAHSKRQYFAEYWLDILAVIPVFRVFRSLRAIRLLRLVRILRLFGVANRLASHYPYVFKRGLIEYLVVICLLIMTVLFGTVAMLFFEKPPVADQQGPFNLESSFWFSVYSLFAGEPTPIVPQTLGGKIVSVFVMFMGVTIFAMFTGTVSAFMIERFRMESLGLEIADVENHVIICGWNNRAEIIIREYQASPATRDTPFAVITEAELNSITIPADLRKIVFLIHDDFTRIPALERARVYQARSCIILADTAGGRSQQDADARTILAALTVEKINPKIYTCAELINRSYGSHLEMGHVNDYVVSGEHSAYMLAQATLNRGWMGMLTELMTYTRGQAYQRCTVPASWESTTYIEKMLELKKKFNATLIAVRDKDERMLVNPAEHIFHPGEEVIVICDRALDL